MLHQNQLSWCGVTSSSSQSMWVQGWSSCQVVHFMAQVLSVSGLDRFDELDEVAGVVAHEEHLDVLVHVYVRDDVGASAARSRSSQASMPVTA